MALRWETVAIPLTGGIDTKTDAKALPVGKLQVLQNGEFTKGGSVRKRFGHVAIEGRLLDNTATGDLIAVANRADELVATSRDNLYGYESTQGRFVAHGDYFAPTHTVQEIATLSYQQSNPDLAVANGIEVAAWEDSRGGVRCSVRDIVTGTYHDADLSIQASNASRPRCVAVSGAVVVLYADSSTGSVKAKVINSLDLATSMASATFEVVPDLNANLRFDACAGDGVGYLLYATDGTVSVGSRLCYFNASGIAQAFSQGHTISRTAQYCAVSYDATFDVVFTFVVDTATTDHENGWWTSTLTNVNWTEDGRANVGNVAAAQHQNDGAEDRVVFFEITAANPCDRYVEIWKTDASTVVVRHSGLASSAFRIDNRVYVLVTHESRTGLQNNYFILRDDGLICGRVLTGEGVGLLSGNLPRVSANGTNLEVAVGFKRRLSTRDPGAPVSVIAQYEQRGIKRATIDTGATPRSDELDGMLYLSGSQVWAYDGAAAVEVGFHMFPDMLTADIAHNGVADADIVIGQTYSYRVYYEWTSANGQRMRSAAITRTFTATAAQQIRLTIPTLRHTVKDARSPVSIVVYRTEGNDSILYYRASSPDPTTAGTANGYLANSWTADTVTFDDGMVDTLLIQKEVDYITQGEVPNFAPEGCTYITVVQNRLWLVGGGQAPNSVRYSKLHFDGQPAEFARMAVTEAPDYGGLTTAMGYINETPVVFKERAIYALEGTGPDNTNQNGEYIVKPLSADTGTLEPGSVYSGAEGVFFKAPEGIHLLDQSGQVVYVGAEAEGYNDQTCVAATSIPDTNQIVFLMSSGSTLMYDTYYKQWSTYTNHTGLSATVWKGTDYVYLRSGSTMYRRDTTVYTDAGVAYKLKIRTAPLRLKDILQGFWRARRLNVLGEYKSSHRLQISVYYDRDAAPFEVFEFEPDEVLNMSTWGSEATWGASGTYWGGPAGGRDYQFQHRFRRQKCQSIRLEFEDLSTGAVPGAAFELTEIALEVGLRDGLGRLPATRKI